MILNAAVVIGLIAVLAAMVMALIRVLIGPAPEDRVLALDTLYINTIALIVLLGMHFRSGMYFEAALLIATMGFVGTIALGKYLERGNLMD